MITDNHLSQKTGKPLWLKRKLPTGENYRRIRDVVKHNRLHTICEAAMCPNIGECYGDHTASFLILGNRCTRNCGFCAVDHGSPDPPDSGEPERIANAVEKMGLDYVVITSVTRDDLPDGGAMHFTQNMEAIRRRKPHIFVELLVPDFQNKPGALQTIIDARPDILNHNLETVPRFYPAVRSGANYSISLELLAQVKQKDKGIFTKSGLMLGLGEEPDEIHQTLQNLVSVGCQLLTLGQYLQPSKNHLPVHRFVPPDEFDDWRKIGLDMGFVAVSSGPLVRSSYHAKALFQNQRPPVEMEV